MYSKYRARVPASLVKQSKCACVLFVKAFLCKREGVLIKVKEDTRWVYVYFVKSIKEFVTVGQEIRLRVLDIDEANKKVKLSYKQLHKTRGIKCRIPEYNIGFTTLDEKLTGWIEKYNLED